MGLLFWIGISLLDYDFSLFEIGIALLFFGIQATLLVIIRYNKNKKN